jgi:hypothetical protein
MLGGSEATLIGHYLHIGGVVAVGFDTSGSYLLVITHSGRGVFSTATWERVARCTELAYPVGGVGVGIGPIAGQAICVAEMNYATGEMRVVSPDGRYVLECESSGIAVVGPDV